MTKFSTIIRDETQREILGVPGRACNVVTWAGNGNAKAPREIANQQWISETRRWKEGRDNVGARVTIRHDDNCRNGHPSFSVTVDGFTNGRLDWGGAAHDAVAEHFPELAPLLRWHLCSTDGSMHYVANTCYHAGDRDHNGLRKGEVQHIRNGKTGLPAWHLVMIGPDGKEARLSAFAEGTSANSETRPQLRHRLEWRPLTRIGEGKAPDYVAARKCAVWPDATDAQLAAPRAELAAVLERRLPGLLAEFRHDVESVCGFLWNAESAAPETA